jgi:hypothetical protein
MRRREFLALVAGASAWPRSAGARQPDKPPIIGFIEGRTVTIARRQAEGRKT